MGLWCVCVRERERERKRKFKKEREREKVGGSHVTKTLKMNSWFGGSGRRVLKGDSEQNFWTLWGRGRLRVKDER